MTRALLVLGLVACANTPRVAERRPPDIVARVLEPMMSKLHVPGMAVAIVRDGSVEMARGVGVANLEWSSPVTSRTRFQIASSTKVFTGTLVMKMVEEGTLDLDRAVSAYLPGAPASWAQMTVRQLAAHAGGLPDDVDPALASVADAYAALRARPLRFEPGTDSRYGTGDFIVLARILESRSGRSFEQLLREKVFAPLGFTCTMFDDGEQDGPTHRTEVVPERATVYRWEGDRQRTAQYHYPAYTYASGGVFSCLDDLTRWAIAMDRHTLLSPQSERTMATGFRIGGRDVGFGVVFATGALHGHAWYGHSGGPALADILRLPDEKLTIIVLSNQQKLIPNLAARLASELLPPSRGADPVDPDPSLATTLARVAEQVRGGTLDEAAFADARPSELLPTLREWGPIQLAGLPELDHFAFAAERTSEHGRARTYRARYGRVEATWTFTLDERSRIVDLDFAID